MTESSPPVEVVEGQEYFSPIDTHLIRSRHVAQTFKIEVMQPARKKGENTRFPVVYAADGNRAFDMLKGISQIIQASGHDAPRFILVGIGYPSDCPRAGAVLRARDFTFPGFPKFTPQPPNVAGVLLPEEGTKNVEGAEDFRQFIEHELIPFVDEKHDTIVGDRTFFGHSGGGCFGLFTLFTQPYLFKNYIVSSPNLLIDGELAGVRHHDNDFLLRDARRFIASGRPLNGIKLYLSVGTEEEFEPGSECWRRTSSFYRLAGLLKSAALPGFALTCEAFARETHMTVWPLAFMHGLRAVFATQAR